MIINFITFVNQNPFMSQRLKSGFILAGKTGKPGWPPAEIMQKAVRKTGQRYRAGLPLMPQVYFGSELLCMAADPATAIGFLVSLEEELQKAGYGNHYRWVILSGRAGHDSASGPFGEDIDKARELLFGLMHSKQRFLFSTGQRKTDYLLLESMKLYDFFTGKWKPARDRKILGIFLEGHDYKVAAEELGIARPQAWKKYRSLHFGEYLAIREILMNISVSAK